TDVLNARYGPGKTIIVPMYSSDRFLLDTKLKIFFLASFPSQNKFIEAKAFYETASPETAEKIAAAHGIDLVAACPQAYLLPGSPRAAANTIFALQLSNGRIPPWLKPVDIAPPVPWLAPQPWLLFEVDKSKLFSGNTP